MDSKEVSMVVKTIARAQAIVAPGLLAVGALTNSKALITVGAVWCALVALDTGRTTGIAIDLMDKNSELEDILIKNKKEEES